MIIYLVEPKNHLLKQLHPNQNQMMKASLLPILVDPLRKWMKLKLNT